MKFKSMGSKPGIRWLEIDHSRDLHLLLRILLELYLISSVFGCESDPSLIWYQSPWWFTTYVELAFGSELGPSLRSSCLRLDQTGCLFKRVDPRPKLDPSSWMSLPESGIIQSMFAFSILVARG
ncbi:hypothetical protein DY000_02013610 [Brassica cretica]|uniref:Uncharacterized protein n=1 Tax=Brassica cretica TaxID=69181 RepID=A0ABQ7D7M7_BRACR|nr:hypothetical protein DY000_02013610 [Brassica cretica]